MASPITCHVLNTLSGTPASGLKATLTLLSSNNSSSTQSTLSFTAMTNEDGRVKEWERSAGKSLPEVMEGYGAGERIAWSIKFDIGPWYEEKGVESFWPEVEVKFYVKRVSGITMYPYWSDRGPIQPTGDPEQHVPSNHQFFRPPLVKASTTDLTSTAAIANPSFGYATKRFALHPPAAVDPKACILHYLATPEAATTPSSHRPADT